jgi:tetratricopeptide (TPR) repeat protein
MRQNLALQTYEDVDLLPTPDILTVASLGHREALADLVWMNALIYIGDEFRNAGPLRNVFRYAEAVIGLDPRFRRVYSWAATLGLYRPVAPTLEEAQTAVSFLERAESLFPNDDELQWEIGAAYSYDLPMFANDDAEKQRLRAIGRTYLMEAARRGAGPPWLALSSATELESLGEREQAARHLEEVLSIVSDEAARDRIVQRLIQLRSEAHVEALRAAEREFHNAAEREFPWLPEDFVAIVGRRMVPPTD